MQVWIVLSLLSAFFNGIKDVLAKRYFKKYNVSPTQLVFEEYFLSLFLVILFFFYKIDFSVIFTYGHLILLKSFFIAMATYSYFRLVQKYEISVVSPLTNLSPLILLFLSSAILGEIISFVQLIGIFLIIIGTYFLEVTMRNHHNRKPHKSHVLNLKMLDSTFVFHLLSFLFSASFVAIIDKIIFSSGVDVFSNFYFSSMIIFVFLFFYYWKKENLEKTLRHCFYEPQSMLVVVFSVISTFLIVLAISIPAALVSLIIPLRRVSTFLSAIGGGLFFHEKHMKQKLLSTIFMILGVFLIVI